MWTVHCQQAFWKGHPWCWQAMLGRRAAQASWIVQPIDEIVSRVCFVAGPATVSSRPLVVQVVHSQRLCPACQLVDLATQVATQEGIALESLVKKSCFEAMNPWKQLSLAHSLGKEGTALWIFVVSCNSRACTPLQTCFHLGISIRAWHNDLTKKP